MKTIFVALFGKTLKISIGGVLCFNLLLIPVVVASAGLLTSAAPTDKTCVRLCPFNYDPICAGPQTGADRAISFGNDCVLANYNCENKKGE